MLKIGIIIGSMRPGRKAPAVADWVYSILKSRKDAEFMTFTPHEQHDKAVHAVADEVIAWGGL